MGPGKRFEISFVKFIGFGIAFDNFPYEVSVDICLPFINIALNFGKSYLDKKEGE